MTELPQIDYSIPYYDRPVPKERFRNVELEILTACDLACFGCDRFSDVTTAPNMTLAQVELFVQESLECGWEWGRIRILGGEPTLHPQFTTIVETLLTYRSIYPNVFLQVLSNGRGKLEKYRQWLLDNGVDPHVEAKDPGVTPLWFRNTRIVPVDRDPGVGAVPPCGIFGPDGCGLALTRHGIFLDGAGASAARVAGLDVGVQYLKDVTWEAMHEQAKILCRICGHWSPERASPEDVADQLVTATGEVTGAYWSEKLAAYNVKKPVLTVYGAGRV